MPFFPSIHRPIEGVPNVPGAISAGTVSVVQLYDNARAVMRTVAVIGAIDGAIHVLGNDWEIKSTVGESALKGAVLVDSESVSGPCASSGKTSSVTTTSMGPRPWRMQSMVAYRSGYDECIVIVTRIPTALLTTGAEYASEVLTFHTRPLDCLSVPTDAESTRSTVLMSVLVRPREHIMRIFSVHVEPSATGRRIHSGAGGGAIKYYRHEPPGHTLLCSSYVQGDAEGSQHARFYGLHVPEAASQRAKVGLTVIPFEMGDERFNVDATGGCFMPLWQAIRAEIEERVLSPASSVAITCSNTPEPKSALGAVSWLVAVGCLDGTVLVAKTAAGISSIQTLNRFIGPVAWLQFFSNRSITRPMQTKGNDEIRCTIIDKLLNSLERETVSIDAFSPLLADSSTFSSQLSLLALDIAGRAVQWAHMATNPSPSYVLDAEEADPLVAEDHNTENHAVPTETHHEVHEKREAKSLPKKDKSIVGRWLNRKAFQSQGGIASSSQADITALVDEHGSHSRFSDFGEGKKGHTPVRDLSHIHSNSARLSAVSTRDGMGVGTVLGRGPVAAAFVDHCFEDEVHNRGPQLLISTLGRVVAFCVQPQAQVVPAPVDPLAASYSSTVSPSRPSYSPHENVAMSLHGNHSSSATQQRLAVIDYFDVKSPMMYMGLADFSGVGDSMLLMAGAENVSVMPLHDRPSNETLIERLELVRELLA